MGAVMLLALIVLVVINLVFTMRIWKQGVLGLSAKRERKFVIPRGKDMTESNMNMDNVDFKALIAQVTEQMQVNAEESGEEEIEVSNEDIEKAKAAVLASLNGK